MALIPTFPHLLHGGDYNPDQWMHAPEVIEEDFRLMKLAGCNTFSVGIFAWSTWEPEEGLYDFSFLDRLMDRMAEAGHNVILATPSGARPIWLGKKYEEVRRVDRQGRREPVKDRHNHCWSSPVFRQKVRAINTAIAQRYANHPALKMWHVSNELNGECFCPLCLSAFHVWLRGKYGTLDALNLAYWSNFWSHRFTDWGEIDPCDATLDGPSLDWSRFVTWQLCDFYEWEATTLREHAPGVPVLSNLMGFFEQIDYHALAPHLDIVADDSYPPYHSSNPRLIYDATQIGMRFDMLRCLKGEPRPWFLMESCVDGCNAWASIKLKDPGLHHLEMFQALAHGAEGTLYFQWRKGRGGREKYHGAVVGHNHAEETRVFQEIASLGQREQKLDALIGSLNQAEVALILDWEARWAYRSSQGVPGRDDPTFLLDHATAQYAPFWQRGITVDILSADHDFRKYKLLLLPSVYLLKPGFAACLTEYVKNGGTIVLTRLTGMVNETNLCWNNGCPGDGLESLVGTWMEEVDIVDPSDSQQITAVPSNALGLSGSWKTGTVCTVLRPRTATPILEYTSGWKAGSAAATMHTFGQGKTYFLGADLPAEASDTFYSAVIEHLNLDAFLTNRSALPLVSRLSAELKTRKPIGSSSTSQPHLKTFRCRFLR